ncbi:MAG: type III pantothenate kinase, partial [Azospira oryzae]
MILLLDAGNTRLKWGLRQAGAWRARGALERERIGDLPHALRQALPAGQGLQRILFCNVAGPEVAAA